MNMKWRGINKIDEERVEKIEIKTVFIKELQETLTKILNICT